MIYIIVWKLCKIDNCMFCINCNKLEVCVSGLLEDVNDILVFFEKIKYVYF